MEGLMEKQQSKEATTNAAMLLSRLTSRRSLPERVEADANSFQQSLRELKDLQSQLYKAADHCETAFLKASQKKLVIENTKNYICQAIVTVVDHLGTVSSNLNQGINGTVKVLETEQRIDCLKQRLLTGQQFALNFDLSTIRWSTSFPRYYCHYASPLIQYQEKSAGVLRDDNLDMKDSGKYCKEKSKMGIAVSVIDSSAKSKATDKKLNSGTELAAVVPSFEGKLILPKARDTSFGSIAEDAHTPRSSSQKKRLVQGTRANFLSFLRMNKQRA